MAGCISCIKDGRTGECRDIKDKAAREEIEKLKSDISALTGIDGGHLATDEDIATLRELISITDSRLFMSPVRNGYGNDLSVPTQFDSYIYDKSNFGDIKENDYILEVGSVGGTRIYILLRRVNLVTANTVDATVQWRYIEKEVPTLDTTAIETSIEDHENRITTLENSSSSGGSSSSGTKYMHNIVAGFSNGRFSLSFIDNNNAEYTDFGSIFNAIQTMYPGFTCLPANGLVNSVDKNWLITHIECNDSELNFSCVNITNTGDTYGSNGYALFTSNIFFMDKVVGI